MKKFKILLSILCSFVMCLSAGFLSACVGGKGKSGGEEESQPTLGEAVSGIIVLPNGKTK